MCLFCRMLMELIIPAIASVVFRFTRPLGSARLYSSVRACAPPLHQARGGTVCIELKTVTEFVTLHPFFSSLCSSFVLCRISEVGVKGPKIESTELPSFSLRTDRTGPSRAPRWRRWSRRRTSRRCCQRLRPGHPGAVWKHEDLVRTVEDTF